MIGVIFMLKFARISGAIGGVLTLLSSLFIAYIIGQSVMYSMTVISIDSNRISSSFDFASLIFKLPFIASIISVLLYPFFYLYKFIRGRLNTEFPCLAFISWALINYMALRLIPPQSYVVSFYAVFGHNMTSPEWSTIVNWVFYLPNLFIIGAIPILVSCTIYIVNNKKRV
jgi:predicted membrane-bound spermidine synthase